LRGRIRRGQFWMLFFEFEQPAKETVVLGIADERIVEDIIVTVVLFNLLTEAKELFSYLFSRWGHDLENYHKWGSGRREMTLD